MTLARQTTLYQMIVDDMLERIATGEHLPGDRLSSIGQICETYEVSPITAKRAVRELKTLGVVETVPARGTYVSGEPTLPRDIPRTETITRVVAVHERATFPQETSFAGMIWAGILDETHARHIHARAEHPARPPDGGPLPRPFTPRKGEGYIFVGPIADLFSLGVMMDPNVPSVLIDSVLDGVDCVLTDNRDGMRQILDHLTGLGHRRICLAAGFRRQVNTVNVNQRRLAFEDYASNHGLDTLVIESGEFESLLELVGSPEPPTALVFTQDDAAAAFLRLARRKGWRVPEDISVTGVDDFTKHPEGTSRLTTLRVNRGELGRTAARLLLERGPSIRRPPKWVTVPGELVVRASSAPPKRRAPRWLA